MTDLSEEDLWVAYDLEQLDEDLPLTLEEALLVQPPPEEPEPPDMDHPPGEWTEYSDTPAAYELLRLNKDLYSPEEAEAEMRKVCMSRGMRPSGEGFFDVRFYCWRLV